LLFERLRMIAAFQKCPSGSPLRECFGKIVYPFIVPEVAPEAVLLEEAARHCLHHRIP
jgi:hypothetical protein